MAKATEALECEHRVIQKAVAVMAQLVEQLELQHTIDADLLRGILEFMKVFGDQCHHGKEESYLFPFLESKGVPATGCPLAALKGEHTKGRQLMEELNATTTAYIADAVSGRLALIQSLQSLITLYPAHIWKEDYLLFPMAEKLLSQEDQELLLQQFDVVEAHLGNHIQSSYEELVDDLAHRVEQCPQCTQRSGQYKRGAS